ncbi:MAG: S53 family peptidase, partial [Candidatus Sulfotelmatobacter sp.]
MARAEFDQGRADGSRVLSAVSLIFKPSAAQQRALNTLLAQQQDLTSANYHKWLTPAQFADRFGVSQNDINKVVAWLQSQGLTVTRIANGRNQIFIEGTIAQIESTFHTEIHNYLVDGELHYANSTEPAVPAALAGVVLAVHNLHNFQPKPRAVMRKISQSVTDPNFTSYISGDHFVAPGDFATIYDVAPLYSGGTDGTGQKIVLTGQSSINLTDVANFRSAASLSANVPTLLLEPTTGTSTRCPVDEGESDLDVEWSGAVAKNAGITLVYAGLAAGDTCTNRQFGAFDTLQYAIDQDLAPIISNSYGNCESVVGQAEADTMQGWIQQANSQGQTVMSASGDSGAADCDFRVKSATQGLAVDIPAAIPEVTAMGGTEFEGDPASTSTTTYWTGTTGSTDTISSALSYIPETGWNDTTNPNNTGGDILASGGGASIFFAKPSWQTGTGVPNDGKRDLPDLALNASPDHDPYLFCSEDGPNGTVVASCTSGFRTGAGGDLTAVGGTSAAAPTFAGIVALISQHLGSSGLGNINPTLYSLAANTPAAFHDVTSGNNIVPCTTGTTGCPATAPFQYGFSAGIGYDRVTGLGSVDTNALADAWAASRTATSITMSTAATNVFAGAPVTFTVAVTPASSVGTLSFSTSNNGST